MNLKEAAAIAKQQVLDLCAPDTPQNVRLEEFLYDDHLGVWSLTIGYGFPPRDPDTAPAARNHKMVRVSQADKSVLSVSDN
jgi:hypothetical protein